MKQALLILSVLAAAPVFAGTLAPVTELAYSLPANPEVIPPTTLFDDASVEFGMLAGHGANSDLAPSWNARVYHATEPGTLVLLGTGLLGVATLLRRRSS